MEGPGNYDDLCTYVRKQSDGKLVLVAVYGGNKGQGFSVQSVSLELNKLLPDILETMAAQIRKANDGNA